MADPTLPRLSFGLPAALGAQPLAVTPPPGPTGATLPPPALTFGVPAPAKATSSGSTAAGRKRGTGRQPGLTAAKLAAEKCGDAALRTVGGVVALLGKNCDCGRCEGAVSSAYGSGGPAGQAESLLRSAQAVRAEWWPQAGRAGPTKASRLRSMAAARRYDGAKFALTGATLGSLGVPICEGAYEALAACSSSYRRLRRIACEPGGAGTAPPDGRAGNGRAMVNQAKKVQTLG